MDTGGRWWTVVDGRSIGAMRAATFEAVDVAQLAEVNQFDLITALDAIHDQAEPRTVLAYIARALRPAGVFLMVDIAASSNLEENLEHPMATFLYMISTMRGTTVSLSLDGEGVGAMWGEQVARELLAQAGFGAVQVRAVESDPLNSYFVVRAA